MSTASTSSRDGYEFRSLTTSCPVIVNKSEMLSQGGSRVLAAEANRDVNMPV